MLDFAKVGQFPKRPHSCSRRDSYARFTNDHVPGTVSLPIVIMLQNLAIEWLKMAHRAGSAALRAEQLFVACFAPLMFLHYQTLSRVSTWNIANAVHLRLRLFAT